MVRRVVVSLALVVVGVFGGAALFAQRPVAPPPAPGKSGEAQFYIMNHGATEAVPVTIESGADGARPIHVVVEGTPTVAVAPPDWEYEELAVARGVNLVKALDAAGSEGWETTGITYPRGADPDAATIFLMKRRR